MTVILGEQIDTNTERGIGIQQGVDMAFDALARWAQSEPAGKAVHAAWFRGMADQFRIVERNRRRWETLDDRDKVLDQQIAVKVIDLAITNLRGDDQHQLLPSVNASLRTEMENGREALKYLSGDATA